MYHSISANTEGNAKPYYETHTPPAVFSEHLALLHEHHYTPVTVTEAAKLLKTRAKAGAGIKPVVITFDDGYGDIYTEAYPLLSKYGYPATVFLPTAYISNTPKQFKGINCLTWSEIRELHAAGLEFGSHTVTHPQLRTLRMSDVGKEVRQSKDDIQEKLGTHIQSFSYPYAFPETDLPFKAELRSVLKAAGYQIGVTTIIGTADHMSDPFFLERLPINSFDDRRFFLAKLAGGYNWLHTPQRLFKLLKHRRKEAEISVIPNGI